MGAVGEGNDEGEVQAGAVEIGTIWNIRGAEVNKVHKMEVVNDSKTKAIQITVDSGELLAREVAQEHPHEGEGQGCQVQGSEWDGAQVLRHEEHQVPVEGEICDMKFHVTDTTNPWASAAAIAKMGNRVVLEDGVGKSYIENVATGKKIHFRRSAPMCWTLIASPMRRFSAGEDKLREKMHWCESCKTGQK